MSVGQVAFDQWTRSPSNLPNGSIFLFSEFDATNTANKRGGDDDDGGHGAAVARAFKRAVADYEIEMRIKVKFKLTGTYSIKLFTAPLG
jgi:hypothetical protein